MLTFELKIKSINCVEENGLTSVVNSINWEYVGKDDAKIVSDQGVQEVPSPNPESFIQVTELTKEIVTAWLTTIFSEEKEAEPIMARAGYTSMTRFSQMEFHLNRRLEKSQAPTAPEVQVIAFASLK